jgi:hypothetical protein
VSDEGPRVQFFPNQLGSQPFMFIDGHSVKLEDWIKSVEVRLAENRELRAALERYRVRV